MKIHYFSKNEIFPSILSGETEIGTQKFFTSSETIEQRFRQEPKMDTPAKERSADELTLSLVDKRIEKGTDPTLRRVKKLCSLLVGRTEVESAGNREASGLGGNHELISPSCNRYDTGMKSNFS